MGSIDSKSALPAEVLGVDRGTVVPRTGRFEITVGVDTTGISEMDDE